MPSFAANVLPEVLKAFRDRYAGINVTVHDVINEQVIEMVREGRVEMGIAFEPAPTNNLLFTPLGGPLYRDCAEIIALAVNIVSPGASC
jgi:LysR family carnitine catabolism transcriptional activator